MPDLYQAFLEALAAAAERPGVRRPGMFQPDIPITGSPEFVKMASRVLDADSDTKARLQRIQVAPTPGIDDDPNAWSALSHLDLSRNTIGINPNSPIDEQMRKLLELVAQFKNTGPTRP